LVTDQGQLIRTPVNQVRMVGRNTSGVIIFRTGEGEHVVGVERLEGEGPGEEVAGEAPGGEEAGGEE
jgi:DNA gyrase subunit A